MSSHASPAVIRHLEVALNGDRVETRVAEMLAPEVLYNGLRLSAQAIVQAWAPLWAAVPDVRWQLEDLVADGERAASWWTVTGTHQADFLHPVLGRAPATEAAIRMSYTLFCRLADGRIVEARDLRDRLALFQQLRILPVLGLGDTDNSQVSADAGGSLPEGGT